MALLNQVTSMMQKAPPVMNQSSRMSTPAPQMQGLGGGGQFPKPVFMGGNQSKPGSTTSMGSVARAPEANIKPPVLTPATNQVSHTQPALQQNSTTSQGTPPTVNPNANFSTNTGNAPQGYQVPPNSGLFGQLIGGLANGAQQGSPTVQQAQQGLMQSAQNNPLQSGGAYDVYNNAVQDQNKLKQGIAKQYGAIESTPIPLEFQQGREQVLARQYASQLDASQQAVNAAQTALGYGIQEQGQQQQGFNQAGSLGNTQQQLQQSGLGTAAGYAQPQLGQYGQTYYSPTNGGAVGGNGEFNAALAQYAQLRATGQEGLIPSSISGNPILNAQVTAMAKQSNPNYNYNAAQGAASATQSNAQIGGTAPVTAANNVYQSAYNDYQNLLQATQNVDQFGATLTSGMVDKSTGATINPSDLKWANKSISEVRSALSSAQQAQFDSTYAALKGKVSGLLSIGGNEIPTQITSDSNKILDGTAPFGTLNAVLQRIATEGNILLQNQAQKVNNSLSSVQGSGGSNSQDPAGIR